MTNLQIIILAGSVLLLVVAIIAKIRQAQRK